MYWNFNEKLNAAKSENMNKVNGEKIVEEREQKI